MRQSAATLLITTLVIFITGCDSKQLLFSGKDLTGWAAFPPDTTSQWSVENGIIICQGQAATYLRSEKEYNHYHLHLEWRWLSQPGDSAVGLHTAGPDTTRPNCIEVHLGPSNAGDLYLVGPNLSVSKMELLIHTNTYPTIRIPKELENSENPAGQWNSLDVFCQNNTIRVFINGFPQNQVIQVSRSRGSICLMSRAVPIEFGNLYLNSLK